MNSINNNENELIKYRRMKYNRSMATLCFTGFILAVIIGMFLATLGWVVNDRTTQFSGIALMGLGSAIFCQYGYFNRKAVILDYELNKKPSVGDVE